MRTKKARLIAVVLGAAALAALGACNTFEGFGKDLERGGEKIQDAAK